MSRRMRLPVQTAGTLLVFLAATWALTAQAAPIRQKADRPRPEIECSVSPTDGAVPLGPATVTYYCACATCCGQWADGITASGRPLEPWTSCAVDPSLIPLGSTVLADFGGGVLLELRADDTGGAIRGAHIDIACATHQEALQNGVRTANIYIKEAVS